MADFAEMARRAKENQDQKDAAEAAARKAKQDARAAIIAAGVGALRAVVIPLLQEASKAFQGQNIKAEVIEKFDVQNYHETVKPSVTFKLWSHARPSDGLRLEGPQAFFQSDGNFIYAGFSPDGYSREAKEPCGRSTVADGQGLIEKTIERAIVEYHSFIAQQSWVGF